MVTFVPNARIGLMAQVDIKFALEELINRSVDLVVRQSVEQSENWIRRKEILSTARTIYEQR
ncbi:MAG: hypothetical protein AAFQ40_01200 [Cyanobacteria bacterium J06623_5]